MRRQIIRSVLAILIMVVSMESHAQTFSNHIGLGVGALYERGFDVTLFVEHETRNHNVWEYFINGYVKYAEDKDAGHITTDLFWNTYRTWGVGVTYKPCVYIGKNNYGNLRLGGSVGSDTNECVGWVDAGYEHDFVLYNGIRLFCQIKTDIAINGLDQFRTGVSVGIKVPIGAR